MLLSDSSESISSLGYESSDLQPSEKPDRSSDGDWPSTGDAASTTSPRPSRSDRSGEGDVALVSRHQNGASSPRSPPSPLPRSSAPPGEEAPAPLNFSMNEPIAVRGLSPVLSSASSLSISAASSTSAMLKPSSVEDRTAASLPSPGPEDVAEDDDALLSSRVLPWESSSFRLPADSCRFVPTTGARHRSAPLPVSDAWPRGRASDARGMVHAAFELCDTPFSLNIFPAVPQSASGSEKEPHSQEFHTPVRTHTSSTMTSNPVSEITPDPAHSEEEQEVEEEDMGMTKEQMHFVVHENRRAVMRVMFASVFDDGEEIKDDVKETLEMLRIDEDEMADLQDIGDAMMEDLEAAENDEEMEAIMYAAVDKYLGIEDNPFLEAAN